MTREIDLLVQAARGPYLVVEKATNLLWTLDELLQAGRDGRYQAEDLLEPAGAQDSDVSGPFPGCLQQMSMPEDLTARPLFAQTRHFLLFGTPEGAGPSTPAK